MAFNPSDIWELPFLNDSVSSSPLFPDDILALGEESASYLTIAMIRYFRIIADETPAKTFVTSQQIRLRVDTSATIEQIAADFRYTSNAGYHETIFVQWPAASDRENLRSIIQLAKFKMVELNKEFEKHGLKINKDLSVWLTTKNRSCLVLEDANNVRHVYTTKIDSEFIYRLGAAFVRLCPWFKVSTITSEKNIQLLKYAYEGNSEGVLQFLSQAAEELQILNKMFQARIAEWQNYVDSHTLKTAEEDYSNMKRRIDEYLNELYKLYARQEALIATIQGARSLKMSDSESLQKFLFSNPAIKIKKCNSQEIYYVVSGHLDSFNIDTLEKTLANDHSYLMGIKGNYINAENIREVFTDIFLSGKYRVKTQAAFSLCNNPLRVVAHSGAISINEKNPVIPNPHINGHGCLGQNQTIIERELIPKKDILGMIDVTISATHNINFGDSTVVNTFVQSFERYHPIKCIECEDGSCISLDDLLKIERSKKEENGTQA